jgi:hypothetical protein
VNDGEGNEMCDCKLGRGGVSAWGLIVGLQHLVEEAEAGPSIYPSGWIGYLMLLVCVKEGLRTSMNYCTGRLV